MFAMSVTERWVALALYDDFVFFSAVEKVVMFRPPIMVSGVRPISVAVTPSSAARS